MENIQKSVGTSKAYKTDAGGTPVDPGPHIGIVKNNIDTARTGKIQVYIEYLSGEEEDNPEFWKPVSYISPFYGQTQPTPPASGPGSFTQNAHSYGMWFTPPDVGTRVICVFANGDPNQGYYFGSVVNPDAHHMLPALGSTSNYVSNEALAQTYFSNSDQLPTVEINYNNTAADGPRFFDLDKPVHAYLAYVYLQQGLLNDKVRGTIGSNSYRESPSTVYGISTPGRPIYGGGYDEQTIARALQEDNNSPGAAPLDNFQVTGRRGGHSIVMDDGDIGGNDQHVRLRTAQGHQIIMSDTGQCIHIMHANGQSWIELGSEGTIDMYATNSVNIRSSGDINMHADRNINMNSRYGSLNIASDRAVVVESDQVQVTGKKALLLNSEKFVGIKSGGTLSLKAAKAGTWNGGDNMVLSAGCISLNGGAAPDVPDTVRLPRQNLPDVKWKEDVGWEVVQNDLETIVSRAPTHEPYPLHGRGINTSTDLTSVAESVPLPQEVSDKLSSIQDVQVATISIAEYDAQPLPTSAVGDIKPEQVRAMLAQQDFVTAQTFNQISDAVGVGKYGFSAQQLEDAGYLKPGTVEFYLGGTATESTILQSPNVWTGLAGVNNVSTLLNDSELQDAIQIDLYTSSLNVLKNNGVITGQEDPANVAAIVAATSVHGVGNVQNWINGTLADAVIATDIDTIARGTQFSVELANQKIDQASKGTSTVDNSQVGTTNRTSIDLSSSAILNEKTPAPGYTDDWESPPRIRQLQSNGNLTQVNIDPSLPYVIRVINDVLTKIYGSRENLLKYYGPARPEDGL